MLTHDLGTQIIETERLTLRRFELSDVGDMIKNWISLPDIQENYGEPVYTKVEEVEKLVERWISDYSNNEFYRWAIILKDCNVNIGQVAFYSISSKNQHADVEYCIGTEFSGKGYATEALIGVINFAFQQMKYNRVQAFHRSKNPSSGRVLQKAGMRYEGTMRQYVLHKNSFDDCAMYAVLSSERELDHDS